MLSTGGTAHLSEVLFFTQVQSQATMAPRKASQDGINVSVNLDVRTMVSPTL